MTRRGVAVVVAVALPMALLMTLVAAFVVPAPVAAAGPATAVDAWDAARAHSESGAVVSTKAVPKARNVRYVAANGNNENSGSATSPWKTVRHAIDEAEPGATIVVYGRHRGRGNGVYAEQDWGDIDVADLTIQAYPGEQPVFKGSRTLANTEDAWTERGGAWFQDVYVRENDRWEDNPYPIDDQVSDAHPMAADPAQLVIGDSLDDGESLEQVASTDDLTGGDFTYEPPGSGRRTRVWVGDDPTGRTIEWSTRQRAVQVRPAGRGARIIGISFTNYAAPHGNTLGVIRVLANDVQLIDVSVTRSSGTGIAASGENGTLDEPLRDLVLRRVTASRNGALGAAIGDAGREGADPTTKNHITIEYSRFDDNNRVGFDVTDCGGGAHCAIAGLKVVRINGLTIRYSSFRWNASNGLWCDLYCERVSIVGNSIADNRLSGVFFEVSRNATIASNVISSNSTASLDEGPGADRAAGIKVTGSTGVVLDHNTLHDNRRQQLLIAADLRDDGPDWHVGSDGIPSVTLVANLFSEGASGDRLVLRNIGSETLTPEWLAGSSSNAYVLAAGTVDEALQAEPGFGERVMLTLPVRLFESPARGDFRVSNATAARWTSPPLTPAALRTLELTSLRNVSADVPPGAVFVQTSDE